ncbi:hypothetical protein H7H48_02155 [Nitratireductor sp. B36]|uniref:hypothetical protein n=1 Tax=Nitratireductor sp. B36 TaxID=2762059 RepID=UPI001E53CDDE|nr:hypothetical protein [Nitratireductor sp. B36]MCC5777839.1 hypothetical protein [Nitratireductor sp. B36]
MAGNLYEQGYYETGTASVTQGQTVVTGQGTAWLQIVRPADDFGKHVGMPVPIASVDSDTQITLAYPWPGPTQTAEPYRISFTPYHVAYRQALQEIGQLLSSGNVSALAGLNGAANKLPIFTGPGALDLIAKQDLVNGVRFDVQVDDLAGRAAYDNDAAGFTVLVADVGDGRSAVYTKNSVAAADWSDPAYITGPTGATGSPWDDWRGAWVTATAYDKLAGVEHNGSSYICTTAHTSDAAREPGVGASWQTYWDLVAAKGLDGDVVGPNGATDGNVALFDGATGKVLKDGFPAGTTGKAVLAAGTTGDAQDAIGASATGKSLLTAASASAARASIGLASIGGMRNKLINPLGTINQRNYNSGDPTSSANEYTLDRWRVVVSGQSLSWTETAGVRTFTASAGGVEQVIEGGAVLSGTYTLNWEGTATATVNGVARAKGESFPLTGGTNVTVRFSAGTFSVPQLEQGSSPTVFDVRHPAQEMMLCERYYQILQLRPQAYANASGQGIKETSAFRTAMRATPTVTWNIFSTNLVNGGTLSVQLGQNTIAAYCQSTGSGSAFWAADFFLDAEL